MNLSVVSLEQEDNSNMKLQATVFAFSLFAFDPQVQAACLNPLASISIPLSGSVTVQTCDQAGSVLSGPYSVYNGAGTAFPVVNGTTAPAVTTVSGNLQFVANGAASGTAGTFDICFNPSQKCSTIPYTVGAPVTSVSFGSP